MGSELSFLLLMPGEKVAGVEGRGSSKSFVLVSYRVDEVSHFTLQLQATTNSYLLQPSQDPPLVISHSTIQSVHSLCYCSDQ